MLPEILTNTLYQKIVKPVFFSFDPETIHDRMTKNGEVLGQFELTRSLIEKCFSYTSKKLEKNINGINFPNPIGLSAGFNYDGQMAGILNRVGFGFQTVGTVTAIPYEGNAKPRLKRLIKSKSLLVNKGFKSIGAENVRNLLDKKDLTRTVIGISIGSSNVKEIDTLQKAIDDVLYTFNIFRDREYVKYFELNISCPNIELSENFISKENFELLVKSVDRLDLKQPVYIKMPNELSILHTNEITDIAIKYQTIKGFIFSNLVKDRSNNKFVQSEIEAMKNFKGNFSGKPTEENSLLLLKNARERYGNNVTLIGVGGVFNAEDAIRKFEAGADLVQLITGMIFEGPQLIGQINKKLAEDYIK